MKRKATKDALIATLAELFGRGEHNPSQDRIVEILGGSKATIGRMMRESEAEIIRLRTEAINQPTSVRDAALALGEQIWIAADAERRLKESVDAVRFKRILDDTHAQLDRQMKLNAHLAEVVDQQEDQIAELHATLETANAELTRLRASESLLRHRSDAAEASARSASDLVKMLLDRGIGIDEGQELSEQTVTEQNDNHLAASSEGVGAFRDTDDVHHGSCSQIDLLDLIAAVGVPDR